MSSNFISNRSTYKATNKQVMGESTGWQQCEVRTKISFDSGSAIFPRAVKGDFKQD
jgi:hypothetical protein